MTHTAATQTNAPATSYAFRRGYDDGLHDRAPLFRSTGRGIEPTVDDPQSDEWSQLDRADYLRGMYEGVNAAFRGIQALS